MSMRPFQSELSGAMNDFVAFQRSRGYEYTGGFHALRYFDRFLSDFGYAGPGITREILSRYAASVGHLAPRTQYDRLSTTRLFARWLHRLLPESALIKDIGVKRPALPRYYLYTREEVVALIESARQVDQGKTPSRQTGCLPILIGLLYTTGLRIGEALALNVGDMDIAAGRLTVRHGKLGKARHVALSVSSGKVLGRFLDARPDQAPNGRDAPLFFNTRWRRLGYSCVGESFRTLLRQCGIGSGASPGPRLHDLRHTFACECLRMWYEQGVDVNAKLPILSTAMGHVHINNTQLYLHVTAQLLQEAADRFHYTLTNNCKGTEL